MQNAQHYINNINREITNPLIFLLFTCALGYFLFGVVKFLGNADDTEERAVGKQHMLWGIVGLFIMFSVFVIIRVVENTLGIPTT